MTEPTISVVIPAYNAAQTLPQTLEALRAAQPPALEIIVVSDGSTDNTAQLAESYSARVIALDKNIGAAAAKNRGAAEARGEVLYFTDADIVVPRDAIGKLQTAFQMRAVDGVVGLLDDKIPYPDWASQYKNLWMNFTYARFAKADRIGLFYTSVAAMKRARFFDLGGFDENYRGASIAEDTEFGQRAWGRGASIVLEPSLRVVHLKAYTVGSVLREDYKRAYALTLMRLRKRGEPFFTSVPFFYQAAVPVIYATALLFLAALVLQNICLMLVAFAGLGLFYLLNASLLTFVHRARGLSFATRTALFLPADVFVVGLGMLRALLDFARGRRY
ncbi:MAG: glycosyltransferase [Anaerolineae bacterium]|nr:glycosyltransferase [Anaerolineae bacterium]